MAVGLTLLAACGSDDESEDSASVSNPATNAPAATEPAATEPAATEPAGSEPVESLGTLRIATALEPLTLDLSDTVDSQIEDWQFLDPIVQLMPDNSYRPLLAAELPTQTNADDPLTWTITLRDDALFHDDTPVTAQAVADWIAYLASYEPRTREIVDIALAITTEVIDETTLQVTFTTPGNDGILSVMSRMLIGKKTDDIAENPVGTGAYRVVEWSRGTGLTMERFEGYYGDPGPYERLEFRYIPDGAARVAAMSSGEVDIIAPLRVDDAGNVPKTIAGPTPKWFTFLPDAKGVFADEKVRQALAYALDLDTIHEALFGGIGTIPECQLGVEGYTGFNPELVRYPYDPDMARQLIEEAGAEGLSFEVLAASDQLPNMPELAQAAVEMWQNVGLDPQINLLPFAQFVPLVTALDGQPDLYLLARGMDNLDYSGYNVIVGEASGLASNNDAELDAKVLEAGTTGDFETRKAILEDIAEQTCAHAYAIFAMNPADLFGVTEEIDFEPSPYGSQYLRLADIKGS